MNLSGLKIPVSAVRFRLWAQAFSRKFSLGTLLRAFRTVRPETPFSPSRVQTGCKSLLGLLFLLGVSGCNAPEVVDIGYHGSDAGYASALEAASLWNTTCGVTLLTVHRGQGDVDLEEQGGLTDGAYGETTIERPVLNVIGEKRAVSMWFMSGDYALPVLAHEFGHALGLGHEPSGIMQPGAEWNQLDPATERKHLYPGEITAEDCATVLSR